RRSDSLNRPLMLVNRITRAIGGIFDRAADKASLRGKPDGCCDRFGITPKAALKIASYRQLAARCNSAHMPHHPVPANRLVPLSDRKRISAARGRQRFKAQVRK